MSDDDETHLLAAVQREPSDEEARLVYADWLEERGDPRGEYLRLEVQWQRVPGRMAELVRFLDPTWVRAVSRRHCVVLHGNTTNKIGAIKEVRAITGLGLKDAKDIVDAACGGGRRAIARDLERTDAENIAKRFDRDLCAIEPEPFDEAVPRTRVQPQRHRSHRIYRCVLTSIAAENRMDAIKRVRETGRGLKEAITIVDAVIAGRPTILRDETDGTTAAEVAVMFAGFADVRIEDARAPVR